MQEFEIIFYEKADGTEPAKDFILSLDNSIVWRLYFYFQGEKYRCTGRNFFNWFPAVL